MKDQEKAKRLLRFTQGVSYNSDNEAEVEDVVQQQKEDRREDRQLQRLGIRPLDSQRYANKLVRDAGLVSEEPKVVNNTAEQRVNADPEAGVASRAKPRSSEVIYSASAPGFTRSSRDGGAVDVSDSRPTEGISSGDKDVIGSAEHEEEDEEGDLTGKNHKYSPELKREIFYLSFLQCWVVDPELFIPDPAANLLSSGSYLFYFKHIWKLI